MFVLCFDDHEHCCLRRIACSCKIKFNLFTFQALMLKPGGSDQEILGPVRLSAIQVCAQEPLLSPFLAGKTFDQCFHSDSLGAAFHRHQEL